MRKLSLLLAAALSLSAVVVPLPAAPARSYEVRQLKKQHKAQRKSLKEQQRAMKSAMGQHELPAEQRRRFKNDLKMQKRLLAKGQKDESRGLKPHRKAAKATVTAASE